MTNAFTSTRTSTFTRTSAAYLSSKVVADLRRISYYYDGRPADDEIGAYNEELTELLAAGYVLSVEYGFKKNGLRVLSLYYEVQQNGTLSDGRAGGVHSLADLSGASWFSFLTYNRNWLGLTSAQKESFESRLPFQRTTGSAPGDGNGHWIVDRSYSADGTGVQRRTFVPH